MLWNMTDENRLAPAHSESGRWTEWLLPDVDGFGLPLVGALLGMEPRPENEFETFVPMPTPQRMT
jgi:hypothetical protein